MKFWPIAAPRGQVKHAYCLTTFSRTIDGRRFVFGILIVGNQLSITERKTGRRMVPLDFKPWESFRELRAQGVACIDDVVKTRGAKALADYIEALAADPMAWRRAAPAPVAPPAIKQSSPKFKCRRCDADRSAADLRCPRCNGQETYHG